MPTLPPTEGHQLAVGLLGPLTVAVAGRPVPIDGARRRALLARLALARGAVVRTDRLVADVWGDEDLADDRAAANLRTYVTKLRRLLGPAGTALAAAPGGYRLDVAADALDVTVAERADELAAAGRATAGDLRDALACWRGRPLEEFVHLPWAVAELARLEGLELRLHEHVVDLRLAAGEHRSLLGDLTVLTQRHPFHERFHARLVVALYRAGRPADALAAQRRACALVRDELGLEPGPELAGLEAAVLAHAAWLASPGGPASAERAVARVAVPDPLRVRPGDPPFVGRVAELAALSAAIGRLAGTGGGVVLVRGEPGVGKTRLVAEAVAAARSAGVSVGVGRSEPDLDAPFGPLVQAVASIGGPPTDPLSPSPSGPASGPATGSSASGSSASGSSASGSSASGSSASGSSVPEPAGGPAIEEAAIARRRMLDGLVATLARCATTAPVVIVLDDLQWAAPSTCTALRHLVLATRDLPVLVIGTVRSVDPVPDLALLDLVAALRRERLLSFVDLAGLGEPEVAELLAAEGAPADPDAVARVRSVTGGNPYFVTELARWAGPGRLPATVADVLAPRLARVGPLARDLAVLVAAAGTAIEVEVLARAVADGATGRAVEGAVQGAVEGAVDRPAVVRALDELRDAGVLVVDDATTVRVPHALAADAVVAAAGAAHLALAHERLARTLGDGADPTALPGRRVEAVARHWRLAGTTHTATAARWVARAGRVALDAMAWEEAVAHLSDALRLAGTGAADGWVSEVQLDLAAAHARAGDADRARAAIGAAADAAGRAGDPVALAHAALWGVVGGRGGSAWYGDDDRIALLRRALDALPAHEVELRVRVTGELAMARFRPAERSERQALARDAVTAALADGRPSVLAAALPASRIRYWRPGHLADRRAFVEAARTVGASSSSAWSVADALEAERTDAHEGGDRARFDRCERDLISLAAAMPSVHLRWRVAVAEAHRAVLEGRVDDVERLAAAALRVWGDEPAPDAFVAFGAQVALARVLAGRADDALPLTEALGDGRGDVLVLDAARAFVLAVAGRAEAAAERLAWCVDDDLRHVPQDSGHLLALAVLNETAVRLGDRERAEVLGVALEPAADALAGMVGPGISWGSVAYQLGTGSVLLGRVDRARAHLRDAVRREGAFGMAPWAARSREALDRVGG